MAELNHAEYVEAVKRSGLSKNVRIYLILADERRRAQTDDPEGGR